MRLTFVEHIDQLMQYNWTIGFEYLSSYSENIDRFVRRAVMRKLYSLIDDHDDKHREYIFQLLLKGVSDKGSTWVCQEAARTLAHFLDVQHWEILRNIYFLVNRRFRQHIVRHLADHATAPVMCETLEALVLLLEVNVYK